MTNTYKLVPILISLTVLGCGSSSDDDQPDNSDDPDTTPKVDPPTVFQTPVSIDANNAADIARRAYFAIITNYLYAKADIGDKMFTQNQGEETKPCMTSGTTTESWNVANINSFQRVDGDMFSFKHNACINSGSAATYGTQKYTVNSSYDSQCSSSCTINQTIELIDLVADIDQRIGIEGTLEKSVVIQSNGDKSYAITSDLFYSSNLDNNEGSEITNYDVSSSFDFATGIYTGSASLSLALSNLNGKLDITGQYTSDGDFWNLINMATTLDLTIEAIGANNSKVTVQGTISTFSILVDTNGDGSPDGAPIVLTPFEFFTQP